MGEKLKAKKEYSHLQTVFLQFASSHLVRSFKDDKKYECTEENVGIFCASTQHEGFLWATVYQLHSLHLAMMLLQNTQNSLAVQLTSNSKFSHTSM